MNTKFQTKRKKHIFGFFKAVVGSLTVGALLEPQTQTGATTFT